MRLNAPTLDRENNGVSKKELLCVFILSVWAVLILQNWVGNFTLYKKWDSGKHLVLHQAIVNNTPASGKTWNSMGANGVNGRILVTHLAETLHTWTSQSLSSIYWWIDTLAFTIGLVLLYVFIRFWFDPLLSCFGLVIFSFSGILTYHFHYFHPWDRLALIFWVLALLCIQRHKTIVLAVVLGIGMLNKPDLLFIPLLYCGCNITRETRYSTLAKTCMLFGVTVEVSDGLLYFLPNGLDRPKLGFFTDTLNFMNSNFSSMADMKFAHPALLAFTIPFFLSTLDLSKKPRMLNASLGFALFSMLVHFSFSNFREIRATYYILLLLLPSALYSFHLLITNYPKRVANDR
ncbi:MAG: hypothetical protein KDD53_05185 [Bdellovibrionales bacterium]|nr:hypothetical protein [Bdellovibrionales bacterium]